MPLVVEDRLRIAILDVEQSLVRRSISPALRLMEEAITFTSCFLRQSLQQILGGSGDVIERISQVMADDGQKFSPGGKSRLRLAMTLLSPG